MFQPLPVQIRILPITLALAVAGTCAHADESIYTGPDSKSKLSASILVQAWAVSDSNWTNYLNLKPRRAEIKFIGQTTDKVRLFAMIDPVKNPSPAGDNKVLSDFGISYDVSSEVELTVGQFKIATTAENLDSSADLLFPERALFSRKWGDFREPGLKAQFKSGALKLRATLTNGRGTNQDDVTGQKDLSARIDYTLSEGVNLGAFTTAGDMKYNDKGRWGAGVGYQLSGVRALFEYVKANDFGLVTSGWGLGLGYMLDDSWQPVARATQYNNGTFTASDYGFGLNYYFAKNQKIGAAYEILENSTGNYGAPIESSGGKGQLLTLVFQAAL